MVAPGLCILRQSGSTLRKPSIVGGRPGFTLLEVGWLSQIHTHSLSLVSLCDHKHTSEAPGCWQLSCLDPGLELRHLAFVNQSEALLTWYMNHIRKLPKAVQLHNVHSVLEIPKCGGVLDTGGKTNDLNADRSEFISYKQRDTG